jgi:hypothetical protein
MRKNGCAGWARDYFPHIANYDIFSRQKKDNKKSDAQVGRVNTFHILQPIRKRPLNFKICMKRPLRFSNF